MATDDQSSERDMGGTVSKLDAALLIFLVSALSLSTSVLYVWSFGLGLRIDFMRYLELKDYLQITASWLCPPMVTYAGLASIYYLFVRSSKELRAMPNRGWKSVSTWLMKISKWMGLLYILLVAALAFLVSVGPNLWVAFLIFVASVITFGLPLFLWWLPNSDNRGVIKVESSFWPTIFRSLPAAYTFAFLFGLLMGPIAIYKFTSVSRIYLEEGAGSQAQLGRILFGMTKNLMFLRESDGEFIEIPSSKVQRIETLPRPLITTALTPNLTTTPTRTPTPAQTTTPAPTPTLPPRSGQ